MLAFLGVVGRHNGKRQEQFVFDQFQQVERFFSQLQRVVAFRQTVRRTAFLKYRVDKLAVYRQESGLQTTLANHLHLDLEIAAHDDQLLLVAAKLETSVNATGIADQLLAEPRKLRKRPLTFESDGTISKLSRIDVRWNRPFQHKRAILGTPLLTVKEISRPCDARSGHIELPAIHEEIAMPHLVLASSSPYRRSLLERLRLPFEHAAPEIDESPLPDEDGPQLVCRLAEAKARALAARYPEHLIIGSDQVASLADGRILGKPHDFARAREQLRAASDSSVTFHTGLCLYNSHSGRTQNACIPFTVHFRALDDARIERYLKLEQPYDCAGSFKSEGLGISLFRATEGEDATSLIGLPLIRLVDMLLNENISVP